MRVVHCRRESYTHYIGRPSVYGNPFTINEHGREKAVELYESWARQQGPVLDAICRLPEDAVLGCWCVPRPCHGTAIARIWGELHGEG